MRKFPKKRRVLVFKSLRLVTLATITFTTNDEVPATRKKEMTYVQDFCLQILLSYRNVLKAAGKSFDLRLSQMWGCQVDNKNSELKGNVVATILKKTFLRKITKTKSNIVAKHSVIVTLMEMRMLCNIHVQLDVLGMSSMSVQESVVCILTYFAV